MTITTNNDAQAALIDWLQANANVLALSSNYPVEIREESWQAEKFTYPNIRVMCEITDGECFDDLYAVISCFSEQKSSKEAQNTAGIIANDLHNKVFTQNSIRFSALRTKTLRATNEGGVWQADVQINGKIK